MLEEVLTPKTTSVFVALLHFFIHHPTTTNKLHFLSYHVWIRRSLHFSFNSNSLFLLNQFPLMFNCPPDFKLFYVFICKKQTAFSLPPKGNQIYKLSKSSPFLWHHCGSFSRESTFAWLSLTNFSCVFTFFASKKWRRLIHTWHFTIYTLLLDLFLYPILFITTIMIFQ